MVINYQEKWVKILKKKKKRIHQSKEILNLNILSDDKIKEIESRYFPENELVELIENPKKNEELFKKILLLNYFNISESEELKNFLKNVRPNLESFAERYVRINVFTGFINI